MKNFLTSRKRKKFLTSSIMKNSWILRMAKYSLTSRKNEFNNCHCLLHIKFKIPPIHFTSCCTTSNRRNILIKAYLMYLYIFFSILNIILRPFHTSDYILLSLISEDINGFHFCDSKCSPLRMTYLICVFQKNNLQTSSFCSIVASSFPIPFVMSFIFIIMERIDHPSHIKKIINKMVYSFQIPFSLYYLLNAFYVNLFLYLI